MHQGFLPIWWVFMGALIAAATGPAQASPNRCAAVASHPTLLHYAALPSGATSPGDVGITYIGHATFLIESPEGVRIETDYNDYARSTVVPDVATMNHAHSSHFTLHPDPGIAHVLRGWNDDGTPARHDLEVKDVHIHNVSTNTRDWGGGTRENGNSIFIFEIAGLCIGHLGHLHHTLTAEQLHAIGQLDVVLVPVDGGYTMDIGGMIEVLRALRARLVIPMHYFTISTLSRFLELIRGDFEVQASANSRVIVNAASLPEVPTVLVLSGR